MANIFKLGSIFQTEYASNWVLESTKHDDFLNVVVIAGVPEVFDDFLDWGLSKYSINFIVDDRSHETGIDIKVMDCFNLNPIMLIFMAAEVHVRTSL